MPVFDIFGSGLRDLDKYLHKLQKDFQNMNDDIITEALDVAESLIQSHADNIDFDEEREALRSENVKSHLSRGKFAKGLIVNVSDHSGYVEYGTGLVGSESPYPYGNPYPGQFMGYNVPSDAKRLGKDGNLYWFWKGQPTHGMPSYHIMYSASKDLEKELPKIVHRVLERRFKK